MKNAHCKGQKGRKKDEQNNTKIEVKETRNNKDKKLET